MVSGPGFLRAALRRIRSGIGFAPQPALSPLLQHVDASSLYREEDLLRLGSHYGGWLLPRDVALDAESVCYLAGAGEDISFDCALVETFGVKARIVDPTPRAIAHFEQLSQAVHAHKPFAVNNRAGEFYTISAQQLLRIRFLQCGMAGEDATLKFYMPKDASHVSCSTVNLQKTDTWFEAQCYRLATLLKQQGDKNISLLKMDIEGGEYAVIDDLVREGPMPELLLIEFDEAHTPLDGGATQRIGARMHALAARGMRCIAIDSCNATFRKSATMADHAAR